MRKNSFQKIKFSTNKWLYALLIIGCSVLFGPIIIFERGPSPEKIQAVEETEFQRAMPFPLLPALDVSGWFHAKDE